MKLIFNRPPMEVDMARGLKYNKHVRSHRKVRGLNFLIEYIGYKCRPFRGARIKIKKARR